MASRFMPRQIKFDEIDVNNEKEFKEYIVNHFHNDNKYDLLTNPKFVRALFNSSYEAFREFCREHFKDNKIPQLLFSASNRKIIEQIDKKQLAKCLNYSTSNIDNYSDILMQDHNYYLVENAELDYYGFARYFLLSGYKKNPSLATDFVKKHPEYIIENRLYREVMISNPIKGEEFVALVALKETLGADEISRFYSLFSIKTMNSLIESGYYSLFSQRDKIRIIEDNIFYLNTNNPPISINFFKNKDFFSSICKATELDVRKILKVENYLSMYYPEIYPTYNQLFKKMVNDKKEKDPNDLCYLHFDDYLENVYNNLALVKEYATSNEEYKKKFDPRALNIILNLDLYAMNTFDDVLDLHYELEKSNINYQSLIYDALANARDSFTNELKENLTALQGEVSLIDDVKVHYYNGEDLSFVVHCGASKAGDPLEYAAYRATALDSTNYNNMYLSTSYINQDNLSVYKDDSIIYGFNNLKNMQLISATPMDSFTSNMSDSPVNSPSVYLNLKDFANHAGYSELVFKPTKLQPDFIVCFDEIDQYDIEMAKKLKLDLVCINTKKYNSDNKNRKHRSVDEKYINY